MENNKYDFDSKENLGHGIKGETNMTANNLKNDKSNTSKITKNDNNKKK